MNRHDASTELKPRTRRGPDGAALCLEVVSGAAAGTSRGLSSGALLIGRDKDADLTLVDSGISRHHARLTLGDDGILAIEDLNSTNGVFLNGRRVDTSIVQCGDRIELGPDVVLRVGRASEASKESSTSARPLEALSQRELEVARLVSKGLSNADVAKRLHISSSTVARHLANIYKRLDLASRTALARLVIDAGLA